MNPYRSVKHDPPPQGKVVETAIIDARGERNTQKLKRVGRLWFIPDGSMYVYYEPNFWRDA